MNHLGTQNQPVMSALEIKDDAHTSSPIPFSYRDVFDHAYHGVMITDLAGVVVDVNAAFTRILGYLPSDIIGKRANILQSGKHDVSFYQNLWEHLQHHGFWQGEVWNRRKHGDVFPEILSISSLKNNKNETTHYIGVFLDIGFIKAHEAALKHSAHYDMLTGVANRYLVSERLQDAIAHSVATEHPIAICMIDLDGFKPINDRWGHAVGDLILVEVATRLKELIKPDDTVARLGGDEFLLILNHFSYPDEIHILFNTLLATINVPIMYQETPLQVSASLGVTFYPRDDSDPDTLLRHADQAMYLAKEFGKNRYHVFDTDHDRQLQSHREYVAYFSRAIAQDEFVLYYQPKVILISGDVLGVEALIRWQHPDQGLILPAMFLHHIMGTDMEKALGEWVIRSALRQLMSWNQQGVSLVISVNVSANHLLSSDFASRLECLLAEFPTVNPSQLELEILESAAIANIEQAVRVLEACRLLGVVFSLDDFGTGYSSLSYFRRLPIDTLKIDQSFVRDILDDDDDFNIVSSVVRLAHAFDRNVVAEGVETLEHGEALMKLGCHVMQGFGIAKPMLAEAVVNWIDHWHETRQRYHEPPDSDDTLSRR